MPEEHEEYLTRILSNVDQNGHLRSRESTTIEFKQSFNMASCKDYGKSLAAFANNKGGYIIFGVTDAPRNPIGINYQTFNNLQQQRITEHLNNAFSPALDWTIGIVSLNDLHFGYIYVYEAERKPVICKINADGMRSGDIFFRYRAQKPLIGFSELSRILEENRERERNVWMKHIESIAKVGPQNIALIDLLSGAITTEHLAGKTLVMDEELLNKLKENVSFIEAGRFAETDEEGDPVLKIIGNVETIRDVVVTRLDPNRDYPYIQRNLAEELGVRPYDVQVMIWKYDLKSNEQYSYGFQIGSPSQIWKYSDHALTLLRNKLNEHRNRETFLQDLSREYQDHIRQQANTGGD